MGNLLARALVAAGGARLVATYDLRAEAAAETAVKHGGQAVDSADALLSYPGLDGVMIALPSYLHAPAVVQAAAAGVDVFCEKPMALDSDSCQDMIAAAHSHDVVLMIGHVLRYCEPYRSILRWQAGGRYGGLFAASIWRFFDGRRVADKGGWQACRDKSGGYLFEIGIHELDMLRCLMGRPQSVSAAVRKVLPREHDMEDYVAAQIGFAEGGLAVYQGGSGTSIGRYGFRMHFEGATLISQAALDPQALQVYDEDGESLDGLDGEFSPENPEEAELRDWLAALRGDAPVPVPGVEGLASVALVEAVLRSAEMGEQQAWTVP
jgi:predicted dehydrogenase